MSATAFDLPEAYGVFLREGFPEDVQAIFSDLDQAREYVNSDPDGLTIMKLGLVRVAYDNHVDNIVDLDADPRAAVKVERAETCGECGHDRETHGADIPFNDHFCRWTYKRSSGDSVAPSQVETCDCKDFIEERDRDDR